MTSGRRRRSRIFVQVESPAEVSVHEPDDGRDEPIDEIERAKRRAPTFIVTPMPQSTTEPMVVVPPRPPHPDDRS